MQLYHFRAASAHLSSCRLEPPSHRRAGLWPQAKSSQIAAAQTFAKLCSLVHKSRRPPAQVREKFRPLVPGKKLQPRWPHH